MLGRTSLPLLGALTLAVLALAGCGGNTSQCEGITRRDDEAHRRTSPGDVQPSSALHLRQGHEGGPDQRRGRERVRSHLECGLAGRRKGREAERPVPGRRRNLRTLESPASDVRGRPQCERPLTHPRSRSASAEYGQAQHWQDDDRDQPAHLTSPHPLRRYELGRPEARREAAHIPGERGESRKAPRRDGEAAFRARVPVITREASDETTSSPAA
jgi:hypothetical protein